MIIDCVSDTHGHYPDLEGGDLLIVAGDLTASDEELQYFWFWHWMQLQNYEKIVVIAGNHDNFLEETGDPLIYPGNIDYLCDSGTEFSYTDKIEHSFPSNEISAPFPSGRNIPTFNYVQKKIKIWGSPWTTRFKGMNPDCMAFTVDTDEELAEKWAMIPDDVDILITHSPPYGMCDYRPFMKYGSKSLEKRINDIDVNGDGKKRLLVCGHIHEGYGVLNISSIVHDHCTWKIVNASHVNERYEPVNKPIRIEI